MHQDYAPNIGVSENFLSWLNSDEGWELKMAHGGQTVTSITNKSKTKWKSFFPDIYLYMPDLGKTPLRKTCPQMTSNVDLARTFFSSVHAGF